MHMKFTNLAQRSAAAAKEIKTLIEDSAVFKLDAAQAKVRDAANPAATETKAPFVERRDPNRAKNVTRFAAAKAKSPPATAAKSGTDGEWTEF